MACHFSRTLFRLQRQPLSLSRLCFLLFQALYFTQLLIFVASLFKFVSRTLLFRVFKMGVNVRTTAMFRTASTYFYSLAALRTFISNSYSYSPSFYRRYFIFAGRTPNFILNSELYFRDAGTRWAELHGQLLFARINFAAPRAQLLFLLHYPIRGTPRYFFICTNSF